MRGGSVIEYVIRAWDKTKAALSSALTNLKRFGSESRRVVEETESNSKKAEDSVSRVFRMAGRLPGVFGQIQTALGRFGMKAAGVIGAFKVGWDIGKWIDEIRVELKKKVALKQHKMIRNQNFYTYMHNIFGAEVINIFDMKYHVEPVKKPQLKEEKTTES